MRGSFLLLCWTCVFLRYAKKFTLHINILLITKFFTFVLMNKLNTQLTMSIFFPSKVHQTLDKR